MSGPWGGGNKTLQLLVSELSSDFKITYELSNDVDIIYCHDPKPDENGLWYQDFIDHRDKFGSKIIQRVGDVGSHRGADITNLVKQSTHMSDFVIFPSYWAKKAVEFKNKNCCIIPNAPLDEFYRHRDKAKASKKFRILTHHWSTNDLKGFEIYQKLGKIISQSDTDIEFHYVGRYSEKFKSEGITLLPPMDVGELARIIPEYDLYLTASQLEAGANHVLEAIASGLPILYRSNGGSIQEYCCNYGIEYFEIEDLLLSIDTIRSNYGIFKAQVSEYNNKTDRLINLYKQVILTVSKGAL